jgi:ELWxxDGT repeat protein
MKNSLRRRKLDRHLALEAFEPRCLLAIAAELAVDVDTRPFVPSTDPMWITECNGLAYYVPQSESLGKELWVSDGTRAGTRLVKDIAWGKADSYPTDFTNVNGTLYFTATTPANGRELWRSDGTAAGTVLVRGLRAGAASSNPRYLTNVNGTLFFTADDGTHGQELWTSDGTKAGTKLVTDLRAGATGTSFQEAEASNGLLYFVAAVDGKRSLCRSDGTAAGTFVVADSGIVLRSLTSSGQSLFFVRDTDGSGRELWKTTGTAASTQLVANIRPGNADSNPSRLVDVGGTLFFTADDGQRGLDLWKSDGTAGGTKLVRDLDGVIGYSSSLVNVAGTLFFSDGERSSLWRSDGSWAGTYRIADEGLNDLHSLISIGSTAYFSAFGTAGRELWKSDGTSAGTVLVKDIRPGIYFDWYGVPQGPYGSDPRWLTPVAGKLVFAADDGLGDLSRSSATYHLWISDGTETGTHIVDDLDRRTQSGDARPLGHLNGKLIVTASDDRGAHTLYSTDGTAAGTKPIHSPDDPEGGAESPYNFTVVGGLGYFTAFEADSYVYPLELWRTDGTTGGTVSLTDFNVGDYYRGSGPHSVTDLNGKVLFVGAGDRGYGSPMSDLWTTDGTKAGTTMVKNVEVTSTLARLGNFVYFGAATDGDNYELWWSDGTEAGTQLLKDIRTKAGSGSRPDELTILGNKLVFTADDGVHGLELWSSDGTAAGTALLRDLEPGVAGSRVANLTVVGDKIYFTTLKSNGAMSLWKTDGTATGTVRIAGIGLAHRPYSGYFDPFNPLTNVNGTLFFVSSRDGHGFELWRSDGTPAGTRLVKDIVPGSAGSSPYSLQEINGVLFFGVRLSDDKSELWVSNGTFAGTQAIASADAGLTNHHSLVNAGGTIYFSGTDLKHGRELWKLNVPRPEISFSDGTLNYVENDPLKLIAPFATIGDADNADFNRGRLTVAVGRNSSSGDRIEIRHQGLGAGEIGLSGKSVKFGGVTIGSYSTGASTAELFIDLNANATVAATQALLRNIGYRNDSDNPSTKPRRVTVTLTDGSGGISAPVSKTINVIAVNDAPRLVLGGQVSYKNNTAGVLLAPSATVKDPDSTNFFGALLTVEITTARGPSNRLQLGGGYSIQSDRLLRNGVVVGTVLENGFGWNDLRLRLNGQMNAARVQELLRSLRFRTVDNTNLDPRTIEFTLTDGDGGVSATQTKTVNLTA